MAQKVEGNPRETGVRKENATEKANAINLRGINWIYQLGAH